MSETISSSQFTYVHDVDNGIFEAVDIHHIFVRESSTRHFLLQLIVFLLFAAICCTLIVQGHLSIGLLWSISLFIILLIFSLRNSVEKESVLVMPAFGIQLETHYRSGRVKRVFVPIGKILKPILNECVTPVTCYWSLTLLLHGETELMLVFQELKPPVKMLVHVWKALCAATNVSESVDTVTS